MNSALNAARRERDLAAATNGTVVDLLVIGLGITGAGVALDAASRGLSVVAVDTHDLAFGTSRWSSKLAHGGLRYLASGNVAIAHESGTERGILLQHNAPHLTRPAPWLTPLTPQVSRMAANTTYAGFLAGDVLRRVAHTSSDVLPRPRRVRAEEAIELVPTLKRDNLRGGIVGWDSQLTDDARLVVAVARTAAAYGARIITRARATTVTGAGATIRDELTGTSYDVKARAVVNAAGVWAGQVVGGVKLTPSQGTHLVVPSSFFGNTKAVVAAPIPGKFGRMVFAMPQSDGRTSVGLTDEPISGPIPDVPTPQESEIEFLLATINPVLETGIQRSDVLGSFAGLRPLLANGDASSTADISRKHAVLTSPDGVVTIVGGKLTTYRRMAQDTVDHIVQQHNWDTGRSTTSRLPLVGATDRARLRSLRVPERLVSKYGTEALQLIEDPWLAQPVSDSISTTAAEIRFAFTHEGALDADDVLDRRTRIGLVDADRAVALPVVQDVFAGLPSAT